MVLFIMFLAGLPASPASAGCELPARTTSYKTLDALPALIKKDFRENAPYVLDPTVREGATKWRNKTGGALLSGVMQVRDKWFVTYYSNGVVSGYTTIGYAAFGEQTIYLGAVQGESCLAVNYLLGRMRFFVLEGWRRQGRQLQAIDPPK